MIGRLLMILTGLILSMLGIIIAIHTDMTWLGLGLSFVITIKFMLMLPDLNERTDI